MCVRHTGVAQAGCRHHVAAGAVAGDLGSKSCPDEGVPMRLRRRSTALLVALGTAAAVLGTGTGPATARGLDPGIRPCTSSDSVAVPGAEHAETACLEDITTAGLLTQPPGRYTDQSDWLALHAPGTTNPTGVRGLQVDG